MLNSFSSHYGWRTQGVCALIPLSNRGARQLRKWLYWKQFWLRKCYAEVPSNLWHHLFPSLPLHNLTQTHFTYECKQQIVCYLSLILLYIETPSLHTIWSYVTPLHLWMMPSFFLSFQIVPPSIQCTIFHAHSQLLPLSLQIYERQSFQLCLTQVSFCNTAL